MSKHDEGQVDGSWILFYAGCLRGQSINQSHPMSHLRVFCIHHGRITWAQRSSSGLQKMESSGITMIQSPTSSLLAWQLNNNDWITQNAPVTAYWTLR